jgi:hypothetical protein
MLYNFCVSAPDVLNINATSTLLELYNMTKDKWTEDYYKHKDGYVLTLNVHVVMRF